MFDFQNRANLLVVDYLLPTNVTNFENPPHYLSNWIRRNVKLKIMKANYFWIGLGLIPLMLGFIGKFSWGADALSHFRIYYLLYFIFLFLVSSFRKNRFLSISSFVLSVLIMISIASFYLPYSQAKHEGDSLKIAAINLWSGNRDSYTVGEYIRASDFDIVVFQEYTLWWDKQLRIIKPQYPHVKLVPREGNFGIAIYSKKPLQSVDIQKFGYFKVPTIVAKLKLEEKLLTIIGTHPVPPINNLHFKARNDQFKSLNEVVKKASKDSEVVLIGDLNCTSFSPNFDLLTNGTTLRDSRLGRGLQTSWNADISVIKVAIDHALVSENLAVIDRKLGRDIGSDHFPLELEVGMRAD